MARSSTTRPPPPPPPASRASRSPEVIDGLRREIRGNRSSAEVKTTTAIPLKPGDHGSALRDSGTPPSLTISGEDRTDVLCELQVWSNGFDETEAKKYASETALKTTETGVSLVLSIKYPEPGTQRATLVVRMPKALTVRIQPSRGKLDIADVAAVELVEARGQATVRRIAGRLTATHRGGALTIEDVAALKLNTRGSTVVLKDIKGDAVMQVQAGELRGTVASPAQSTSSRTAPG